MGRHVQKIRTSALAAALALLTVTGTRALGQQSAQKTPEPEQNAPASQSQPSTQGQPAQGQPAPSLSNPGGAPPAQPQASPEETQAFEGIQKETDPDKQIQLVKDFEKQYPKSALLSDVYFFGSLAAWQKGDVPTSVIYGQESLKLQPNNLRTLILVSGALPLPQALQGTVDQKEQQLTTAEDDGNHALQMLAGLQPPPNTPPDQFDRAKKTFEAEVHAGLGMAHLEKAILAPGGADSSELAAAEQDYRAAVASPQPASQDYFRLGEVCTRENKFDDAINAFTQAAALGQGKMKDLADDMIKKLKAQEAKTGGSSPAAPSAKHD